MGALNYASASILPVFFALATTIFFTRLLTVADYGILSLVLSITAPLGTAITEWIAQSVGRFYAEYEVRGQLILFKAVVSRLLYFVAAIVTALSLIIMLALLAGYGSIPYPFVFLGAAGATLIQSLFSIVIRILPISLQSAAYHRAVVLSSGLGLGISLVLTHVLGANIAWLLWGPALATATILPYVYSRAGVSLKVKGALITPSILAILRRFWSYGAPMPLWFFAVGLLDLGDRYTIQFFHGAEQVGVYAVNYNLASQAIGLINGPLFLLMFPVVLHQWARSESGQATASLSRITDIYMTLGFGMIGYVAVVGHPLTEILFGPGFQAGQAILLPVLAGKVLWGLSIIGQKGMELAERTAIMVWHALAAAALNLILNLIFIPSHGYTAAAYTTGVSYLCYAGSIWLHSRRYVRWELPWMRLCGSATAAIIAYLVVTLSLSLST